MNEAKEKSLVGRRNKNATTAEKGSRLKMAFVSVEKTSKITIKDGQVVSRRGRVAIKGGQAEIINGKLETLKGFDKEFDC